MAIGGEQLEMKAKRLIDEGASGQALEVYRRLCAEAAGRAEVWRARGELAMQLGLLEEAESALGEALRLEDGHAGAWQALGAVAGRQGRSPEAERCCLRAVELAPREAQAHANLGNALMQQGRLGEAEAAYGRAVELQPDLARGWLMRAQMQLRLGRFADAEAGARRVTELTPQTADGHLLLAKALHAQGRFDEAARCYRGVLRLRSGHAGALVGLATIESARSRHEEAEKLYRQALDCSPGQVEALTGLGLVLHNRGRSAEAEAVLQEAVQAAPGFGAAHYHLVSLYESCHRLEEARVAAANGLAVEPRNPDLNLMAARLDRRCGALREARERLEGLLPAIPEESSALIGVHFELSRIYEREGRYAAAFDHGAQANRYAARSAAARGIDPARYRNRLARDRSLLESGAVPVASPGPSRDTRAPVFLVGFPRSGTTLVGRALDCHPEIEVMEEQPLIPRMRSRLMDARGDDTPATVEPGRLRDEYLESARAHVPGKPGALFIDKHPLNTAEADVIARIFPDARFVLVLRHPYDCCLSAFMQDFTLNDATANFLSIEDAAACYAQMMAFWETARTALGLEVHTVRYEDLVTGIDAALRPVLEFLDLDWDPAVCAPHDNPGLTERAVKNPSYHQVAQPVYTHSRDRWRHYQERLADAARVLDPWVEHFGYTKRREH